MNGKESLDTMTARRQAAPPAPLDVKPTCEADRESTFDINDPFQPKPSRETFTDKVVRLCRMTRTGVSEKKIHFFLFPT